MFQPTDNNRYKSLKVKIIVSLSLSLMLAIAIQFFSFRLNQNLSETNELVVNGYRIITAANETNNQIRALESNVRGYAISDKVYFIDDIYSVMDSILLKKNNLKELTIDNLKQRQNISLLFPVIDKKIEHTQSVVRLITEGKNESAINLISSGVGKKLMDEIKLYIHVIKAHEYDHLNNRLTESQSLTISINRINKLSTALISFILILGAYVIMKDLKKQKDLETALREKEIKTRQLLEALPIGITISDAEGQFEFTNKVGKDIMSETNDSYKKVKTIEDLNNFFPLYNSETNTLFELKNHPISVALQGEYVQLENIQYKRNDNSIDLLVTACPVFNSTGKIEYAIAAFMDISERKKIQHELLMAKETAEKSVEAKDLFLTNMSHEIRTPMNAIIGFTNLLTNTTLSDEQIKYVNAVKVSGENLLEIINDILDFSKIEAGMVHMEKIPFNLNQLLQTTEFLFQPKADDKKLKLKFNYDRNAESVVIGDPLRLNQIFVNLIGNAIKFTDNGFVELEAKIVDHSDHNISIEFIVRDSGIGIPQEKLDSIFERFSQASNATTRKFGGTGLGLSIAKSLVELQKGHLSVESIENKGSTFTFTIPFEKASLQQVTANSVLESNQSKSLVIDHLHILVVEDNVLNQTLATTILNRIGCTTEVAVNGLEAIEKLKTHEHFDLIIMDIQMPVLDGYQATKIIRTELNLSTPIIAMTANIMTGEKEKCLAIGMNDYISKPFRTEELVNKINSLVASALTTINKSQDESPTIITNAQLLNLSYLKELSEGNIDFEIEMLSLFLKHIPNELDFLRTEFKNSNISGVKSIAHKLKSSASLMGALNMKEKLNKIENSIVDDNGYELQDLVHDVSTELEQLLIEIKFTLDLMNPNKI